MNPKRTSVVVNKEYFLIRIRENTNCMLLVHLQQNWESPFGQLCTQEKENEIVVIPELLDMLCIKDCIITIDALGCQRTIAEKVIKGEGDYIFIVKDNQPKLKETVLSATESIVSKGTTVRFDKYETHEEGHGRNESRICYCCNDPGFLGADIRKKWKNIRSFGYIENTRNTNKGTTVEKDVYIFLGT